MYGHDHEQYFNVINSISNPKKHIGVQQIGPSVTTNMYKNPSYALIEVDEETMLPLNYQMWALDIQKANAAEDTSTSDKWELVLDYVKDYKLDGYVTPNEMHKLAVKVGESRSMASLFRW